MREEVIKPIEAMIEKHEGQGENMDDIREILKELKKIGCSSCVWYSDGECLYYDRIVDESYYCRLWDKKNDT